MNQRERVYEWVGSSRSIEGRLSGGFPYRPFDALAHGLDLSDGSKLGHLARLEVELRRAATASNPGEAAHALAVFQLLSGDVAAAIDNLTALLSVDPRRIDIRNDLAVAHAHSARLQEDPSELLRALATLERGPEGVRDSTEVLFNRALVLERLGILLSSARALRELIQHEADTPWADEARDRLVRISDPRRPPTRFSERISSLAEENTPDALSNLVRESTQKSRLHVERMLLPAWAAALQAGEADAASMSLSLARRLSVALADRSGDHLLLRTIRGIESLLQQPWRAELHDLLAAFGAYREGILALDRLDIVEARTRFGRALDGFRRAESPFSLWARLHLAICDNYEGRYREALGTLDALEHEARRAGYGALLARASWIRGFAFNIQATPATALLAFDRSLQEFERLGENEHAAFVSLLIAEAHELLGQPDVGWRHRYRALSALGTDVFSRRASVVLTSTSEAISNQGFSEVALFMQNDALELARVDPSSTVDEAESLWRRALIYQRLRRWNEAASDLDAASALVSRVGDASIRGLMESNINRVRAEISLATDPESAVAPLTAVLEAYRDSNYRYLLLDVLRARARAHVAENDFNAAQADLLAGIDEAERQREAIDEPRLRTALLDAEEGLYDDLLRLQTSRGDVKEALSIVERSRARSLLDKVAGKAPSSEAVRGRPLDTASIQRAMPEGHKLVEYEVADDELLVWVIGRDAISQRSVVFDPVDVSVLLEDLKRGLAQNARVDVERATTELYSLLVEPVESELRDAARLVISTDDVLGGVPFAILRNPRTSRYLLEEHSVVLTPSASIYLSDGVTGASPLTASSRALVVANPLFHRTLFPRLPSLPAAETVPSSLQELGPRLTVLRGREATAKEFLQGLPAAEVVHFAGHALVNRDAPSLSQLILAPEADRDDAGVVYARDIASANLSQVAVAVLSACSSATGRMSGTEGVSSLASAFLAGGARGVVAGLWEVEDADAAALFESFYRHLATGVDAPEALRRSQLERVVEASIADMKTWAAFIYIGRLSRKASPTTRSGGREGSHELE